MEVSSRKTSFHDQKVVWFEELVHNGWNASFPSCAVYVIEFWYQLQKGSSSFSLIYKFDSNYENAIDDCENVQKINRDLELTVPTMNIVCSYFHIPAYIAYTRNPLPPYASPTKLSILILAPIFSVQRKMDKIIEVWVPTIDIINARDDDSSTAFHQLLEFLRRDRKDWVCIWTMRINLFFFFS